MFSHGCKGVPGLGGAQQNRDTLGGVLAKPLGGKRHKKRGHGSPCQDAGRHIARKADHRVVPFTLTDARANGVLAAEQRARGSLIEDDRSGGAL